MAQVIRFPSPRDKIEEALGKSEPLRFGYMWRHDVRSPEFRALGSEARLVYQALVIALIDETSQTVSIGRTLLGELAGIHRANTRRATLELVRAGLVDIDRHVVKHAPDGTPTRYRRHSYTLTTPPSVLMEREGGQQLLFRRVSLEDKRALLTRAQT
jgi:hypothetical protein